MRPVRIATVTTGPSTGLQGTERFLALLVDVLKEIGAEVHQFHFEQLNPPRPWSIWDRLGWRVPANAGILAQRALRTCPPFDLFIAHGLCGWALPPERKITIYHGCYAAYAETLRGHITWRDYITMRYIWGWAERRAGRASVTVALSAENAEYLRHYYGTQISRVIVNAIDTDYYQPTKDKEALRLTLGLPPSACVVLFAGTWSIAKGADIVASVAESNVPNLIFLAATNAPPTGVGVPANVRLFLRQSPAELRRLYQAADIFLFPSRSEACSLALAEAMACGLVPVASRVGAWQEITVAAPSLSQFLLPPSSGPEKYIQAISRLASNPSLRAATSASAAQAAASLFSLRRFRAEYQALVADFAASTTVSAI
ncbi:MAG: glycosyltransferase family 4 protein [Armatimonadetes bacterium]|nr:glycosyltransferase family 4 protein [Armatimonadota bacterium]